MTNVNVPEKQDESKPSWGLKIKEMREAKGWTQEELAQRSGLSRPHIAKIEAGGLKESYKSTVNKLARAFNLTPSELDRIISGVIQQRPETPEDLWERLRLASPVSVPVYEDFGLHAPGGQDLVEYVYRARTKMPKSANIEGFIVHGKCLEPEISDGNVVIVDRDAAMDPGDIIACIVDGRLHIGRLRQIAGELWLENNDGRYPFKDCHPVAKVIETIKRFP
jgi:transcriptional regulator with XRE-family HTH domain